MLTLCRREKGRFDTFLTCGAFVESQLPWVLFFFLLSSVTLYPPCLHVLRPKWALPPAADVPVLLWLVQRIHGTALLVQQY